MKKFKEIWDKSLLGLGTYGWLMLAIGGIVGAIIIAALIVMCLAKRKQKAWDDRRTSLDLLEEGRLTPVRSKSLPARPEANTSMPDILSPHPFQPESAEVTEGDMYGQKSQQSSNVSLGDAAAPQSSPFPSPSAAIPIATQATEGQIKSSQDLAEPIPKPRVSAENLNAMVGAAKSPTPASASPKETTSMAASPKSPVTSNDEFFEAQDQVDEDPFTMGSPQTARKKLPEQASPNSPGQNEPTRLSGWSQRMFRSKP